MIVADTNLVVYLLIPGEESEEAQRILRADSEWAVPALWRSEMRSVLVSYLRQRRLSLDDALEVMERAESLLHRHEYDVPSGVVLALASASRCSAYDCEFVALAQHLGVRLVTSDRAVLKAFPGVAIAPRAFGV
jgi:predicted nucleic acid-binding protein